jgi:CPA1 family monovalent cation:H+ antiporter
VSNEILGISGVVATVTLATFVGSGSRTRVSPGSWEVLHNVWEHLDFWATSFIFIISAMYIPKALTTFTWHDVINVCAVFVAALASRAVVIGGMMPTFSAIGASKPLRRAYKIVLWWGGMRGAVTVALALATTATDGVPEPVRHLVASTAVGYVIASLILNGLTLRPLMKLLRLDKFNELDHALRYRMVMLARRRIKKELNEVAAAVGYDADEISKAVVPHDKDRPRMRRDAVGLALALDTWCSHELDTVLTFRERGLITRHHADMLRNHTDRLLNALRNGEIEGYVQESERLRRASIPLKISFWLYQHFQWSRALKSAVSGRMEYLVAELLLIRDLIEQCDTNAAKLFGKEIAMQLKAMLDVRVKAAEQELKAIERAYPKFAGATHHRYLSLVALGLVEAEYRRHLSEATISADVFEDLDAQRRTIAAQFTRVHEQEATFDARYLTDKFPWIRDFPDLKPCLKPYLAFPGQHIALTSRTGPFAYFVVSGQVEVRDDADVMMLGAGDFFGVKDFFSACRKVSTASSAGYVNLIEIDWARLRALMNRQPEIKERLTVRAMRRAARVATAS